MKFIFKSLLLLVFLSQIQIITAQDTVKQENDESFKTIAPRIGIGFHNYLNCELGVSFIAISNRGLQWGAASFYSTVVFQQPQWQSGLSMYGLKLGVQSSWAIFMWGIEWKNMHNDGYSYNYLSPKLGLSWLDVINIEYAINVIGIDKKSPLQSKHQIGINISINKKLYKTVWKPYFKL